MRYVITKNSLLYMLGMGEGLIDGESCPREGREFTYPQPLPKPALSLSKGGKGLLLCDESTRLREGMIDDELCSHEGEVRFRMVV